MKYRYLLFFFFSILFTGNAGNNPRSFKAVRTALPPIVDGFGNDEVWKQAAIATDFLQLNPNEGEAATERTEVKLLYDDENIYLYAMMYDSSPDKIVARLSRRDDDNESDYFVVGFDSYNDKQTSFLFFCFASGSKRDGINYNDGRNEDFSWDPVWDAQTQMLSNGWSVEMKIPLSQMRFAEGNNVWGINFARKISRTQEETQWALIRKSVDGVASYFGSLTGMADVKLPSLLEVLPYGVVSSEHYPQTSIKQKIEKLRPNAGVDIKYGTSSNFTLDATFNPDFAQVEADPTVLNLTTFETFYPEKRPFFIEGTQILRFVTFGGDFGPGLFYSRRIGKALDVNLPDDGKIITDEPHSATILGAVKFSGKTENGTSIGFLTALTDEEEFTYFDTLGISKTHIAEPTASYNLFRIKQDFWETSNIGGILTATTREGKNPAYTGGVDWNVKFDSNTYRFNGFLAHSRFFLPNGSLHEGSAGSASFGRISGNWVYNVNADFTSKAYYINDLGFFRSPNDYGVNGNIEYREFTPGKYFRSWNVEFSPHLRWNFDKLTLFKQMDIEAFGEFLNYWSLEGAMQYSFGEKNPYEARGLGAYNFPASYFIRGELQSDNREPVIFSIEENFRRDTEGAVANNFEGALTLRPTTLMEYRVSLGYATDRGLASFADIIVDTLLSFARNNPVALFGKRNVDQTDVTLRSSILFTNNLSLQLYNQFFWAKGSYGNFSVLQPDGNLLTHSYSGNPDFTRTSFISNVVLRWEFREGSTMYFVWSHGRRYFQNGGYTDGIETALQNTFGMAPDNTYVVKASYWINL